MTNTVESRRATVCANTKSTLIEFILDETGSMQSCKAGTLSGFNAFLDEQRQQSGTALLSLTKFDTTGLKTPFTDLDTTYVPYLTADTFLPGQGTNLRDAIGSRVRSMEERLAGFTVKPNVLIVVLTDGDDNASRSYDEGQIRDLIRAHEVDGWTFVYLGATTSALATAARLGFQPGNARAFDTSRIHETMQTLATATTAYRSTGSTKTFFAA